MCSTESYMHFCMQERLAGGRARAELALCTVSDNFSSPQTP